MSLAHQVSVYAVAAACVSMGSGCTSNPRDGYAFSSSHSDQVLTVHVPVFENDTYSHELEFILTDAIVKEIQASTPWRVTNAEYAQTTLSGRIRRAELRKLSTGRDSGLVESMAVALTVDFDLTDNRTGRSMVARREFTGTGSFVPARGLNERIEVGENAAIQKLATDIVAELRSDW